MANGHNYRPTACSYIQRLHTPQYDEVLYQGSIQNYYYLLLLINHKNCLLLLIIIVIIINNKKNKKITLLLFICILKVKVFP